MEEGKAEPGEGGPATSAAAAPTGTGPVFFKKPAKSKNVRRRQVDESEDGDEEGSAIQPKSKLAKKADGKLAFSTSAGAATKAAAAAAAAADARGPLKTSFAYESSRQVQTQDDNRATAVSEIETALDRDARAIRERVLKNAAEALQGSKADDKVYRGMAGYKDHTAGFRREHTVGGDKASGAHGPLRASAHIRMSVRFDYQPDICKDYKETGYCGYGDSCKFMHDRGDYKSGWQLEKEWDEKEKKKRERVAMGATDEDEEGGALEDESDEEVELPFACFICRQPFTDPVVTLCRHYFCEHCALKHHSRNKNCFVCNKPTNGVFNTAHEILKRAKEGKKPASEARTGDAGDND